MIVCAKQVPDPEGPASAFQVDREALRVIPQGISPVINPFDENALEAALRIKDRFGAGVTVLTVGETVAQPVMRKALAAGADKLVILTDPLFKDLDSYSVASVLAASIKKLGPFDIILFGRQAGDWDFGVTGPYVADMLEVPVVSLARRVEIENRSVLVEQLCEGGYKVVKAPMPVVVTVSSEVGELRYPNVRALVDAKKKPVTILHGEDIGLDFQNLNRRLTHDLIAFEPARQCTFAEGGSLEEKIGNLMDLLKGDRIISSRFSRH